MKFVVKKKFNELTNLELYKILKLRNEVFIIEQNCLYLDIDDIDLASTHLFIVEDDQVIASTRLIPSNVEFSEASIGRVVVRQDYRSKNIEYKLMRESINYLINNMNENTIKIEAQSYAIKFYEKVGFKNLGDEHILDGIPHVWMIYPN